MIFRISECARHVRVSIHASHRFMAKEWVSASVASSNNSISTPINFPIGKENTDNNRHLYAVTGKSQALSSKKEL
jgi:hypothetical protein